MKINYNKLTAEQIEKHVEFIDWSVVPPNLITEELKIKFGSISQLQARLWLEGLLLKMVKYEEQNHLVFSAENKWYMDLSKKTGILCCSNINLLLVFENKYKFNYDEAQSYIRNILKMYFKKIKISSVTFIDFIDIETE